MGSLAALPRDLLKCILPYVVHQGGLASTSRVCKRWQAINAEIVNSVVEQIFLDSEQRSGLLYHYVRFFRDKKFNPAYFFQGIDLKAKQLYGKNFPHKIPTAGAVCEMIKTHEDLALEAAWPAMHAQTTREEQSPISAGPIRTWMITNPSALSSVRSLELCHLKLKYFPIELGYFPSLTWLNLSNNSIARLPSEMGALTSLGTLYLQRNVLLSLPPEIGAMTALRSLQLHDNRLFTLPKAIGRLTSLRYLGLRSNDLFMLPSEIGGLTQLTVLNLSDNRLHTIPPQIGQLEALQFLYLTGNPIRTLPHEIGQLNALEELWYNTPELPGAVPFLQNLFYY